MHCLSKWRVESGEVACRAQADQAEPAVVVTTYNILGVLLLVGEGQEEEEEEE